MKKGKLKSSKKVLISKFACLGLIAGMLLNFQSCTFNNGKDTTTSRTNTSTSTSVSTSTNSGDNVNKPKYRSLEELRQAELPTYVDRYEGQEYCFVREEDVLEISREFKYAIEDYFKEHGAGNFTNLSEFWPEDIEYIVTAIAFTESTYRTNCMNEVGCGGLAGIKKEDLLKSLNGWANNTSIWGKNIPYINCNPDEVDIFNAVISIEYTYYNIAYNLVNRFRKDKTFTDQDGKKQNIWKNIEYSEDTQTELVIASHFWGMTNVVNGALNNTGKGRDAEFYQNSDYVNKVLKKKAELINTYENDLEFSK